MAVTNDGYLWKKYLGAILSGPGPNAAIFTPPPPVENPAVLPPAYVLAQERMPQRPRIFTMPDGIPNLSLFAPITQIGPPSPYPPGFPVYQTKLWPRPRIHPAPDGIPTLPQFAPVGPPQPPVTFIRHNLPLMGVGR